jgi:hypothetical protein
MAIDLTSGLTQLKQTLSPSPTVIVNTEGDVTTKTVVTGDNVEVTITNNITGETTRSTSTAETSEPNIGDGKAVSPAPYNQSGWIQKVSADNQNPGLGKVNPKVYPHNQVWPSKSGHSFQMDDTKDAERVRIEHRTGTHLEMHPDGSQTNRIYGDCELIVDKNANIKITGSCNLTIVGDCTFHVKGNRYDIVDGDYFLQVKGMIQQRSEDDSVVSSGKDYSLTAGSLLSGGTIKLAAHPGAIDAAAAIVGSSGVHIDGDITVDGRINASLDIVSKAKICAGTQIVAGPLGFLSELGGLYLGSPASLVGPTIVCAGPIVGATTITAGALLFAPLNTGIITSDIGGPMLFMRLWDSLHTHVSTTPGSLTTSSPLSTQYA